MVIKVSYTYIPIYNQSSKKGSTLSNLTLFSYGPAVHLISWKYLYRICVDYVYWLTR